MICRKCIARIDRIDKFREHLNDDEYWRDGKYSEEWEWWAWRISTDFEDQASLQEILRGMKSDNLTIDDYNKVIELLSMVMMTYKYSQEAYDLPR